MTSPEQQRIGCLFIDVLDRSICHWRDHILTHAWWFSMLVFIYRNSALVLLYFEWLTTVAAVVPLCSAAVKTVPIMSAAAFHLIHIYPSLSCRASYWRQPQTKMCNLMVLCILNATALRVFPHSLCIMLSTSPPPASTPQLGEVSFPLSTFWHGHRCVPTLTAWRLCLPL